MQQPKAKYISIILALCSIGLFILDLALGSVAIPFGEVIEALLGKSTGDTPFKTIILEFRLPRATTAVIVGAALPVSGLLMQTFFQNPIAGPYVLGISSGASLGVAILILASSFFGIAYYSWSLVVFAAVGGGLVLLLVLAVSLRVRDVATLLIVGLMVGSAVSAVVTVLEYFSGEAELKRFMLWSFGNLAGVTKAELYILLPIVVVSLLWSISLAKPLNALLLGEAYAKSMGIPLANIKWQLLVVTAILAGSVTAYCGPIGFVGIAVPHIARMLFRTSQHWVLLPNTILIGIVILLICDIVSQVPGQSITLPINAITALFGAPMVVWIVLRRR